MGYLYFKTEKVMSQLNEANRINKSAKITKKVHAVLPAELMTFIIRLREEMTRNNSDTIAIILLFAKLHLEEMSAEERGALIEKTMQVKKGSIESWQIQSVIPDTTYEFIVGLSKKLDIKISPTIALLVMVGAKIIAEGTLDYYWTDFSQKVDLNDLTEFQKRGGRVEVVSMTEVPEQDLKPKRKKAK